MKNSELIYMDLIARGRQEATARAWRGVVLRFEECCGVKDEYVRADVIKFVGELRSEGIKQSSINTKLRAVKLLCKVQGWDKSFPELAMPKVRRCDVSRPVLSSEDVGIMIRKAKSLCSEREVAYLAAATTYGLRRGEIGSLKVYDGVVKVDTLKGGEVTIQLVPCEIKEFIKGYRGCDDARYVTRVFCSIIGKTGVEVSAGYGWHSIRRALATELLIRDVSLLNIMRFMRWSDASVVREVGMLGIYAGRKQEDIDRSVFEDHPFLDFWTDGVRC